MTHLARITALAVLIACAPLVALAAQYKTVKPDDTIRFYASTSEVTRLSVKGDRIRRVVNDNSQFEMTNDENTGDVFLRFSGEAAKRETGYIITENEVTIGYELRPSNKAVEPVIVTIKGVKPQQEAAEDAGDFAADDVGFSDNIALSMTGIVKSVATAHVLGKRPRGYNNQRVKTVTGEGWKATVRIAAAGKDGRLVREQDFYREGVRAVWINKPALAANERTFVIVVESR